MKTAMLFTGNSPIVILTSYDDLTDPVLLEKLAGKGIEKFIAYEISLDLAKQRYGGHFNVVSHDLHETDDLRILDFNGERAFRLFQFGELKGPITFEGSVDEAA
jgi:hypothetical protein